MFAAGVIASLLTVKVVAGRDTGVDVIPAPQNVQRQNGTFKLEPRTRILVDDAGKAAGADLDVAAGHQLTPEERAALDELSAQVEGYDAAEIQQAMKHMVEAQTKRKVVDWPKDLKRKTQPKKPEA